MSRHRPLRQLRQSRYSGVVSAGRGWRDMASLLKLRAFGFRHVKLKLEHEGAVEAARTARRLLGHRVDLRVDANMAWEVEQALALIERDAELGIESFEQPIAADDLAGLARLVRGILGRDRGGRGLDRPRLVAAAHQPARLHRGQRAHLEVRGTHRCPGPMSRGSGRRPHASTRLPSRRVLAAVGCPCHADVRPRPATPVVRYAEGCFGRHLLRGGPGVPIGSVRLRGGVLRHAQVDLDSVSTWIRPSSSGGRWIRPVSRSVRERRVECHL